MIKLTEVLKHKKIDVFVVVIWTIFCLLFTPVYTTVTVNYTDDPSGEAVTTVFTSLRENVTSKGARARVIDEGVARISFYDVQYGNHCSVKRIDPMDSKWQKQELVTISKITVCKNGFEVWNAEKGELQAYFTGNDQVNIQSFEDGISFYVLGADPQLLVTEQFAKEYVNSGRLQVIITSICFGLIIIFLLKFLIKWYGKGVTKTTDWIYLAGILGAIFLCIYLANRSPFWLNPDEADAKRICNYYVTHWMPPDIRSDSVANLFSIYGTNRLAEYDTFYFWTGKLGKLFTDTAVQCRILNMILFTAMAAIIVKNCKKYFALVAVLLLTPQIWYIFSYCTSDALDFFVAFLSVYQLIKEDSLLNRLLKEPLSAKKLPGYTLISLLFVHLFWAKRTFYPVLLFIFLILLINLFEKKGKERLELFVKYLLIVGMTFGIFLIRYMITDFGYYGFEKQKVINEMMEIRATYPYKPSTPPHEQSGTIYLYNKGLTLKEFFDPKREFNKTLFRTVAGFFGYYHFGAWDWYYAVMAGLYITLFVCLVFELKKSGKKKKWMEFGAVLVCISVQYVLIVINGYFLDFQPQGRYMLPALLYVTYLIYTCDNAKNNKFIRLILCATCVLSLYVFITVGLQNMIPLDCSVLYER